MTGVQTCALPILVKKLLVRHGAAYGVDSKVGEGSVFWFELDVSEK